MYAIAKHRDIGGKLGNRVKLIVAQGNDGIDTGRLGRRIEVLFTCPHSST